MAGVHLLGVSYDLPRKIAKGTAGQLKDGEWIEGIGVIVIIVERQFLRIAQIVVQPYLELVPAVCRPDHILRLGIGSSRTRQVAHLDQTRGHRVKTSDRDGGHESLGAGRCRKDGIPRLWGAIDNRRQRGSPARRELATTTILENGGHGRVIQRAGEDHGGGIPWGRSRCRQRSGEGTCEVACGGHGHQLRDDASHDTPSLIRTEDEGFVFLNGPAERAAELILLKRRFRRGLEGETVGVEHIVAQKFVNAAVKIVGAGFGDNVNH